MVYDIQYNATMDQQLSSRFREGKVVVDLDEDKNLLAGLLLELRRGTLGLSVLSQMEEPRYGYALVQSLEDKGVAIDPNTLYPLLRRLEKQGLLCSEWEVGESKPRKYYRRTAFGDQIYCELKSQWELLAAGMERLLNERGSVETELE